MIHPLGVMETFASLLGLQGKDDLPWEIGIEDWGIRQRHHPGRRLMY